MAWVSQVGDAGVEGMWAPLATYTVLGRVRVDDYAFAYGKR